MAKRAWVSFAVMMLAGFSAHAETVEVVLDVTTTHREVSHLDEQGTLLRADDPFFVPKQFQWVVSFDLAQPTVYPVQTAYGSNGAQLIASTYFQDGTTSLTPYSAALMGAIPADAPVLSPDTTQVRASLATKNVNWLPMASPQAVDVDAGFAGGGTWQSVSDGLATTTTYGRGFVFERTIAPVLNKDFHPMSGQEFVAYLQANVGQLYVGAFNESVTRWVQKTNPPGDVILVSNAPDALVAQDGMWVGGDVSIRSVTVVPEPATYGLMGLGLAGVAAVARRRRSQA